LDISASAPFGLGGQHARQALLDGSNLDLGELDALGGGDEGGVVLGAVAAHGFDFPPQSVGALAAHGDRGLEIGKRCAVLL
jgi:hypothetical protein